jgi:hypothetical protein
MYYDDEAGNGAPAKRLVQRSYRGYVPRRIGSSWNDQSVHTVKRFSCFHPERSRRKRRPHWCAKKLGRKDHEEARPYIDTVIESSLRHQS